MKPYIDMACHLGANQHKDKDDKADVDKTSRHSIRTNITKADVDKMSRHAK